MTLKGLLKEVVIPKGTLGFDPNGFIGLIGWECLVRLLVFVFCFFWEGEAGVSSVFLFCFSCLKGFFLFLPAACFQHLVFFFSKDLWLQCFLSFRCFPLFLFGYICFFVLLVLVLVVVVAGGVAGGSFSA